MTGETDGRPRNMQQAFEPVSASCLAQKELLRRCHRQLVTSPRRAMLGEVPHSYRTSSAKRQENPKNWSRRELYALASGDSVGIRSRRGEAFNTQAFNTHLKRRDGVSNEKNVTANSANVVAEGGNQRYTEGIELSRVSPARKATPAVRARNKRIYCSTKKELGNLRTSSPRKKNSLTLTTHLQKEAPEAEKGKMMYEKQSKRVATSNTPKPANTGDSGALTHAERLDRGNNSNNKVVVKDNKLSTQFSISSDQSNKNSIQDDLSKTPVTVSKDTALDSKQSRKQSVRDAKMYQVYTNVEDLSQISQDKKTSEQRAKTSSAPLRLNNSKENIRSVKNNGSSDLRQRSTASMKPAPSKSSASCTTFPQKQSPQSESDKSSSNARPSMKNKLNVFLRLHHNQKKPATEAKSPRSAANIGVNKTVDDAKLSLMRVEKKDEKVASETLQHHKHQTLVNKNKNSAKRQSIRRQSVIHNEKKIRHISSSVLLVDYTQGFSQSGGLAKGEHTRETSAKNAKGKKPTRKPIMRVYEYNPRGHRKNIIVVSFGRRRAKQKVLRTENRNETPAAHLQRSVNINNMWRARAASPATIAKLWRWVDTNRQLRQKEKLAGEFGLWNTGSSFVPATGPQGSLAILNKSATSWKAPSFHGWSSDPAIEEEKENLMGDLDAGVDIDSSLTSAISTPNFSREATCDQTSTEKVSNEHSSSDRDWSGCCPAAAYDGEKVEQIIHELDKCEAHLSTRPKNRLLHLSSSGIETRKSRLEKHNESKKSSAVPNVSRAFDIPKRKGSFKSKRVEHIHTHHHREKKIKEPSQASKNTSLIQNAANRCASSRATSTKRKNCKHAVKESPSGRRISSVGLFAEAMAECNQATERLKERLSSKKTNELISEYSTSDSVSLHQPAKQHRMGSGRGKPRSQSRKLNKTANRTQQTAVLTSSKNTPGIFSSKPEKSTARTCKPQTVTPTKCHRTPGEKIPENGKGTTVQSALVSKTHLATKGFKSASDSRLKNQAALTRLSPALPSQTSNVQCKNGGDESLSSFSLSQESKGVSTLNSFEKTSRSEESKSSRGLPVVRFGSSLCKHFRHTYKASPLSCAD